MSPLRINWWTSPWTSAPSVGQDLTIRGGRSRETDRAGRAENPHQHGMEFPTGGAQPACSAAGRPSPGVMQQWAACRYSRAVREGFVVVPAVPAQARRHTMSKRPQSLSAAEKDVSGHVPDQVEMGLSFRQRGFDGVQIGLHRLQDSNFEIAHATSPIRSYSRASLIRARTNRRWEAGALILQCSTYVTRPPRGPGRRPGRQTVVAQVFLDQHLKRPADVFLVLSAEISIWADMSWSYRSCATSGGTWPPAVGRDILGVRIDKRAKCQTESLAQV